MAKKRDKSRKRDTYDERIYFTQQVVRNMYIWTCRIVNDPCFHILPIDEQLQWLKHKRDFEKNGVEIMKNALLAEAEYLASISDENKKTAIVDCTSIEE